MPAKEHVHRYVRAVGRLTEDNKDSGFIGYYKCNDPECSHYTKAELILGKKSICNRCGAEFILPLALRALTNRPHCKDCTKKKTKVATVPAQVAKVLEQETEMDEWIDLADIEEEA